MNSKLIISLSILFLISQLLPAQHFTNIKGKAIDIAIHQKGSVYIVGTSKNIFKYSTSKKEFIPFIAPQTKKMKAVKVNYSRARNTSVYTIGTDKNIYKFTKRRRGNRQEDWHKIPGKRTSIAIDNDGKFWGVNNNNDIEWFGLTRDKNSHKWFKERENYNIKKLAVHSKDLMYIIKSDNSIHEYRESRRKWNKMPGAATEIAIDMANADVYVIGTSKRIFKWNKTFHKWEPVAGTRKDFKKIAVHDGIIWALTTDKKIYTNNTSIKPTASPSLPKDYKGTYRFTLTRILTDAPEQQLGKGIDIYGTAGIYLDAKIGSNKIQIKPAESKSNRIIDIPKGNSVYVKAHSVKEQNVLPGTIVNFPDLTWMGYRGEYPVDIIREFKIDKTTSNKSLTFDLQTNFVHKLLLGEGKFGWKRQKIKVDDIEDGKERFFRLKTGGTKIYVGFKIKKHK